MDYTNCNVGVFTHIDDFNAAQLCAVAIFQFLYELDTDEVVELSRYMFDFNSYGESTITVERGGIYDPDDRKYDCDNVATEVWDCHGRKVIDDLDLPEDTFDKVRALVARLDKGTLPINRVIRNLDCYKTDEDTDQQFTLAAELMYNWFFATVRKLGLRKRKL